MSKILKVNNPDDWDLYHYLVYLEIEKCFPNYSEAQDKYMLNNDAAGDVFLDENLEPYGYDYDLTDIPKKYEYLFKNALKKLNDKMNTNYEYPEDDE